MPLGNALNLQFTTHSLIVGASPTALGSVNAINSSSLTTTTAGIPTWIGPLTNGQLIIGSTGGNPAAATLTAGAGITITNGANSITIASPGGIGVTWQTVNIAAEPLQTFNGYVTDRGGGVTYTLPATANLGDPIIIVGQLGITTIAQNANQQILISGLSSTVGILGSVNGNNVGDCITLTCIVAGANTVWRASSFVGNWTVT